MKKKSILLFENALFWVDNRELITKCLRKVYQKRIKTGKGILKKHFVLGKNYSWCSSFFIRLLYEKNDFLKKLESTSSEPQMILCVP